MGSMPRVFPGLILSALLRNPVDRRPLRVDRVPRCIVTTDPRQLARVRCHGAALGEPCRAPVANSRSVQQCEERMYLLPRRGFTGGAAGAERIRSGRETFFPSIGPPTAGRVGPFSEKPHIIPDPRQDACWSVQRVGRYTLTGPLVGRHPSSLLRGPRAFETILTDASE